MYISNKSISSGFSAALAVFPVALAMGVCTVFSVSSAVLAAVIAAVCGAFSRGRISLRPAWLPFLAFSLTGAVCGTRLAFLSLITAGVLTAVLARIPPDTVKRLVPPCAVAGVTIAAALVMTGMQTTNYFGIGAQGSSFAAIISDYISLGFHGNWLGVLYGTVTLVIMITYPRKFKSISKRLPAQFVSLLVTLALNLFLNPDVSMTAISEVGRYGISPREILVDAIFSESPVTFSFSPSSLAIAAIFAVSLALLCVYEAIKNGCGEREIRTNGICLCLCSFAGAMPVTCAPCKDADDGSNAVCAVLITALYIFAMPLTARLPVPTLAVILIVTAWQAVDWHKVRLALTGGLLSLLVFTVVFLIAVLAGISPALCAVPVFGLIFLSGSDTLKKIKK